MAGRTVFEVGFEIDDDVRDRDVEAVAGGADDVPLEPVRTSLRVGGDHDLVGAERAQRVLHRLKRVGVPDGTFRLDVVAPELGEACIEPILRGRASAVLVGGPVPYLRVEGRADDEDPLADAFRFLAQDRQQLVAPDGLVRDHENPPLVRAPDLRHRSASAPARSSAIAARTRPQPPSERRRRRRRATS